MRLNFIGDLEEIRNGIDILKKNMGFEVHPDGVSVMVVKRIGNLDVVMSGGKGTIRYQEKIHFFRALGLFVEALQQGESFNITEEPQFTMDGIMIDVSRNSVMKVESLKKTIEIMAVMGLNMMMLYTEDTYEVKTRPYFGYMRGRYTQEELKECDDYADIFGIEMIPCIQTLAHLSSYLKWDIAKELKDTEDILLAGSEKTFEFIDEMIRAAAAPFRSKRIHIGMDEAHNLGRGKYLDSNGYCNRFDIMTNHLSRVKDMAHSYGLKPMIWSDMYFRLASKTGDYYDENTEIPQEVIDKVPSDVQMVYWDYYHFDEESYVNYITKHKKFHSDIIFSGGIWTWTGIAVNYEKTIITSNAALAACKKEGIKEVFATIWGDNGSETNFFSGLLGLQLYAEHGYSKELDIEKLKRRFKFCTNGHYDAFMNFSLFDNIPYSGPVDPSANPSNPTKFLLWQDLLIGLFDKHAKTYDFPKHYTKIYEIMKNNYNEAGRWQFVFDMPCKLAEVLSIKSHLGIKIKDCYDRRDNKELENIANNVLPELYNKVYELKVAHKKQWFSTYKPFGWEVIDLRYGGLLARIESAKERLMEYINGTVDRLEELEEGRLTFDGSVIQEGGPMVSCNLYHRIVTAGSIGVYVY